MSKTKILFILPTLTAGGAERIISFVAENIDKSSFDSHLIIIGNKSEAAFEVSNIKLTFLNKSRVLLSFTSLFKIIFLTKPHIVMSSIGHLNTMMGLIAPFFLKTKFVFREASVISAIAKYGKTNFFRDVLSKIAFRQADKIICQSNDMAIDFQEIYNISSSKIEIINNPITIEVPARLKTNNPPNPHPKYITIGRLSKEKGHERILTILSKLSSDFKYTIIGSGSEKESIFKKINELGLEDKITYVEHTNDVTNFLLNNDFFLQGSYVEGFPNALLESCALGTPVIAFNVPGGTKEIINHGINGFLVESEEEFLNSLSTVKNWDSKKISQAALEKFSKTIILHKYETMFNNVLN